LSDRVTVLRDGRYIGCIERENLSEQRLVQMMVGRDASTFYQKQHSPAPFSEVLLSVQNVGDGARVFGASFDLRAGEVLGIAGIVGAGRTELARLIYGADPKTAGQVTLDGQGLRIGNPLDAIHAGIVYLTEDRKGEGLFL